MARRLIILLIVSLSGFYSFGQESNPCVCDSLDPEITEPKLIGDLFVNQVTGTVSQYFIDEWLYGTVFLTNHLVVQNKLLKYNGFLDRVIWITDNYQQVKLDKESVDGFCLNEKYTHKSYCFQKIRIREELSSDSTLVYAQLLYKGNLSLYAYRKVIHAGTTESQDRHYIIDEFEKKDVYYFKFADNQTAGFKKINKKNILKVFPGKKEEIINLFRSARQRQFKTQEDLIEVAALLNGMK